MSEKTYILLTTQGKSVKPLQKKIRELGGFYTGIGYAFPQDQEEAIRNITKHLSGAKIHKLPLGHGQSFSSVQQAYHASFFREKLFNLHSEILYLQSSINCEEISEASQEKILELLAEKEKLKKSIEWAEGMEKAISSTSHSEFHIQFIHQMEKNFLITESPPTPMLVNFFDGHTMQPFIRKGIVGMIVGAGGVGKTHALAQLAISIASGENWLGIYPIEKPGSVFFGLGENHNEDVHRLIRKIAVHSFEQEASLFEKERMLDVSKRLAITSFSGIDASFVFNNKPTPFYNTFLSALKQTEPPDGWSCIILDPISRFLGSDSETDSAAATRFISLLERMTLELRGNPSVIFGHHMNKSSLGSSNTNQTASRGSSAITDGVRWQANLEVVREEDVPTNHVMLKVVKSNFTPTIQAQKFRRKSDGCLTVVEDPASLSLKRWKK